MSNPADYSQHPGETCSPECAEFGCLPWTGMPFDFEDTNPDLGATFVVEHLATGTQMGLGSMSPALADRMSRAWRGRKKVIPA